jgi:hypothetical protein
MNGLPTQGVDMTGFLLFVGGAVFGVTCSETLRALYAKYVAPKIATIVSDLKK